MTDMKQIYEYDVRSGSVDILALSCSFEIYVLIIIYARVRRTSCLIILKLRVHICRRRRSVSEGQV